MRQRAVIVVLAVLALLTVGLSAQVVLAQSGTTASVVSAYATGTAAAGAPGGSNTYTVAAGQSVSIPANFWCLDFSKPFPKSITGPTGEASPKVVNVLRADTVQGVSKTDPYQMQLAVWHAIDNQWHNRAGSNTTLAQQLANAAGSSAATPAASSNGLGALKGNGGLTVTVQNFVAVPDKAGVATYHGTGNVVVTNTGSQTASFTLDGAVFQPTTPGAQTLVAQATGQPQTMSAATATTAATVYATTAATAVPTTAATAAPAATVAPTTAATAAAMTTAVAQATTAATATAGAMATPATLPVTGASGGNGWMFVLLLLGALTLFAGFGLGARARR